jgi:hypothetical protein
MKKGMILYITEGRGDIETAEVRPKPGKPPGMPDFDSVRLAASEDDIVYYWWHLISRGMQEVSCMKATYDAALGMLAPFGTPMRLCG